MRSYFHFFKYSQVSESACTSTAILGGVKNNFNVIGLTGNVARSQCNYTDDEIVYSFTKWAQDAGMATGIVTTARITDSSPAGEIFSKLFLKG